MSSRGKAALLRRMKSARWGKRGRRRELRELRRLSDIPGSGVAFGEKFLATFTPPGGKPIQLKGFDVEANSWCKHGFSMDQSCWRCCRFVGSKVRS